LELFIQFITRLPEEAKGRNRFSFDQHWTPLEAMETCRKSQRDFDNLDAQKLSYKTMLILCQSNQTTTRLYESRLREIVLHLFNVFQPRSNGNFYHVREVFQFLLKLQPRQFIEILIAPTPAYFQFPSDSHESMGEHKVQRPLLLNALPYAKEPAVADMIIEILFYPDPESNGNVSEIRLRTFKTLREHGFIEYLVDLISIDDPQGASSCF
jgi:hypothetical protein